MKNYKKFKLELTHSRKVLGQEEVNIYVYRNFSLVDGDGWLSLFQLVGGNRDKWLNHHTIIQKWSSPWKHPVSFRQARITHRNIETRPETIVTYLKRYPTRRRFTLAKCAGKRLAIGGITQRSIDRSRIYARCVNNRSQGETIWKPISV